MSTYLLRIDASYPDDAIGIYSRHDNPDRFAFLSGRKVDLPQRPLLFTFNVPLSSLRNWDVVPSDANLFLVFQRAAQIFLDAAYDDVQLIPTIARCTDGDSTDCLVLNVISQVQCIDHDKSSYTTMKAAPAIRSFSSLVLKDECMSTYAIAREVEFLPYILISQVLHDEFQSKGVKGVRTVRPEELALFPK